MLTFVKRVNGLFNQHISICDYVPQIQRYGLLDMIEDALDLELTNQKQMFVLYDDAGKLTLKNISSMKVGLLIDPATGEATSEPALTRVSPKAFTIFNFRVLLL